MVGKEVEKKKKATTLPLPDSSLSLQLGRV